MFHRRLVPRRVVAAIAVLGLLGAAAPAFAGRKPPSGLKWGVCANPDAAAAGWQCATFKAPRDYSNPSAGIVKVAVTRLPAKDHRTGRRCSSTTAAQAETPWPHPRRSPQTCSALSTTTSTSSHSIRAGLARRPRRSTARSTRKPKVSTRQPFVDAGEPRREGARCQGQGLRSTLRCPSTKASCRTPPPPVSRATWMEFAPPWGTSKLNYFGFSYGTLLGATYASLFPDNYRAMVLDGPIDPQTYFRNPLQGSREQAGGLRARARPVLPGLRFDQSFCQFGGDDPWKAFDALVAAANAHADSRLGRRSTAGERR